MIRSHLAVFAWLILAACTGTEGAEVADAEGDLGDGKKIEVCALLPAADLAKITGRGITEAEGHFTEHDYMKPVNFTSGCVYAGGGVAFIISINYPRQASKESSQQLAKRLGDHIRSQYQDDPDVGPLYAQIEMRPVEGMAGPAAEYSFLNQTHLEVYAPRQLVQVVAPSLEEARALADTVLARLD